MIDQFSLGLHIVSNLVWLVGWVIIVIKGKTIKAESQFEGTLSHQQTIQLMSRIFTVFWFCIAISVFTGFYLISKREGFLQLSAAEYFMIGGFLVLLGLTKFSFFAPFSHLKHSVAKNNRPVTVYAVNTLILLGYAHLVIGVITFIMLRL